MRKQKKAGEAKGAGHIATLAALNQFIDWRGVDAADRADFTTCLVRLLPVLRGEIHWMFRAYPFERAQKILAKTVVELASDFPEEDRWHIGAIFMTAAILILNENPPGMIPVERLEALRAHLWELGPEEFRHPQPDPVTPTGKTAFYSMFAATA